MLHQKYSNDYGILSFRSHQANEIIYYYIANFFVFIIISKYKKYLKKKFLPAQLKMANVILISKVNNPSTQNGRRYTNRVEINYL
jgi:hypothetical protein